MLLTVIRISQHSKMLSHISHNLSIDFVGILPHHIVNKTSADKRLQHLNDDACTPLYDYDKSLAEQMIKENRFNPDTLIEKLVINEDSAILRRTNINLHYNIIIKYSVIHNRLDIFTTQVMIYEDRAEVNIEDIIKYDRREMFEFMEQAFILRGWNDMLKYCIKYNSIQCANCILRHHEIIRFEENNQGLLHAAVFNNRLQIVNLILPYCKVQQSMLNFCAKNGRFPMLLILSPHILTQWKDTITEEIAVQSVTLPYRLRHYILPVLTLIFAFFVLWVFG